MRGKAAALATTACVLAIGAAVGGTAAAPSTVFDAQVSMDTVDIRVTGMPPQRTLIYDDELLPYQAHIANAGQDCYIRVRASLDSDEGTQEAVLPPLDERQWVKAQDGWVYYKPVLPDGEAAVFTMLVGNPMSEWDGRGMPVYAAVTAQAIQASNFQPDYDAPDPWGDEQTYVTRHFRESD